MITRFACALAALVVLPLAAADGHGDWTTDDIRAQIERMKEAPRGPFRRIRWFCNDGSVLPPGAYRCRPRGGGHQHGQWSDSTRRIRAAGFPVANLLADLGGPEVVGTEGATNLLRSVLLEQFLIVADDGWILRRARYYRGAFQIEDELRGAQRVLEALANQPGWHDRHYPLLVEAARLLPSEAAAASAARVRGLATALNEEDPDFLDLRTKIHNRPGPEDAEAVRAYAASIETDDVDERYLQLAEDIDALYALPDPAPRLESARRIGLPAAVFRTGARRFAEAPDEASRIAVLSEMMAAVRDGIGSIDTLDDRVAAARLLLELEAQVFARSQQVVADLARQDGASRAAHVGLLGDYARSLYGLGLLTGAEHTEVMKHLAALRTGDIDLASYRSALAALDRVPGWASRRLGFYFDGVVEHFAAIEPLAREFIPDRLRGSPLLHYGMVLKTLAADAALLAGVTSELFGTVTVTGLRSLNPGIGRGVLATLDDLHSSSVASNEAIVIVPQTLAELPAVAGIITAREGNALLHVQLLARNLGIPNVVVAESLMGDLLAQRGQRVELAASPGGVVVLAPASTPASDAEPAAAPRLRLDVDPSRLDLETLRLLPTSELTQADSGVRVGPKAAQLGELTRYFPENVSPGLAIPFGVFRQVLDTPRGDGGPSTFDWMKDNYRRLAAIEGPAERSARTQAFLAELRAWIESAELDPALIESMRTQILDHFGEDGSFGVFVRSDTNVEDVPGFTGAGLNLTVPNVSGVDAILAAVRRVWASPFTERAFGWRQALMDEPEHVYAAVLLHASVDADKSGVLITADIESGARDTLSVVVNEGVGGGVEGQSAEALRIALNEDRVALLGSATAPTKRVLIADGGSRLVPASGAERVLTPADIDALRALTKRLDGWFRNLPPEEREAVIADVEFGFHDDQLVLFQIRPFVASKRALGDPTLARLDARLVDTATRRVALGEAPRREEHKP